MAGAGLPVQVSAGLAGSTARLPTSLHVRQCLPAGAWLYYSSDACRESCRPANQCSDEWDAARSRLRNWDRRCGVLGPRTFRKTCIQTNKCGQQVNSAAAQCCNVHKTLTAQASAILFCFLGRFWAACVPGLSNLVVPHNVVARTITLGQNFARSRAAPLKGAAAVQKNGRFFSLPAAKIVDTNDEGSHHQLRARAAAGGPEKYCAPSSPSTISSRILLQCAAG